MKKTLLFIILTTLFCCGKKESYPISSDFNFDWQFRLIDSVSDGNDWKEIRLPHDWSVEASFDSINGEGATGYLPGGIGQYKKEFPLNLSAEQMAYVVFDGVYNNATVLLNGKELGFHPYGYSPFYFDITSLINEDDTSNTLAVNIDRTRYADSRWYSGSGIYRNVELHIKNKLHIPIWGTFVTTPKVSEEQAEISVEVKVSNGYQKEQSVVVQTEIFNVDGFKVGLRSNKVSIGSEDNAVVTQLLSVEKPILWDIDSPYIYKAITSVVQNGKTLDTQETSFGIRSFRFDANEGFFLNGKNRKIKGVCLHHDGGLVGAAVPKGVWKRRLEKLRKAGCNAIRISHNPGSQEFLDLCDEMGFLVQDEFFDEWDNPKDKRMNMNEQSVDAITRGYTEHFQEWAEKDLKNTVLAHRNHPSIIQWSIGNEIEWTYPRNGDATGFFNNMHWSGNYFWELPPNSPEQINEQLQKLPKGKYDIGQTAKKLAGWTRELDTTRYITANCILPSSSHESGYTDALDIVGYSYRRVLYDYGHKNYPEKPIMGMENLVQWHEWKAVMERPFISGTFLWTGVDYLGESNGGWPKKATASGMLDLAGFEKPSYYMLKSLWNEEPMVYIATQTLAKSINKIDETARTVVAKNKDAWEQALWEWHPVNEHWDYNTNETIAVEVYSNCDEVELFLNNKSLGSKMLLDFEDRIYKWAVPYEKGNLTAKGKKNGEVVESKLLSTSEPTSILLILDKQNLKADGYDVAHIEARLVDKDGNAVKTENRKITFQVDGQASVLGVDNGSPRNVQDYKSNTVMTSQGKALILLQSKKERGTITISATSENLDSTPVSILIK